MTNNLQHQFGAARSASAPGVEIIEPSPLYPSLLTPMIHGAGKEVGEIQRATVWMTLALMRIPNSMTKITYPWPSYSVDEMSLPTIMTVRRIGQLLEPWESSHLRLQIRKRRSLLGSITGGKPFDANVMQGKESIESIPSRTKLAAVEPPLLAACGVSSMYL